MFFIEHNTEQGSNVELIPCPHELFTYLWTSASPPLDKWASVMYN